MLYILGLHPVLQGNNTVLPLPASLSLWTWAMHSFTLLFGLLILQVSHQQPVNWAARWSFQCYHPTQLSVGLYIIAQFLYYICVGIMQFMCLSVVKRFFVKHCGRHPLNTNQVWMVSRKIRIWAVDQTVYIPLAWLSQLRETKLFPEQWHYTEQHSSLNQAEI